MSYSSCEIPTLFARKFQLCAPTAFCIHPSTSTMHPTSSTGPSCPSLALLLSPSQIHVQTAANLFHSSFTQVASLHRQHPHKVCFLHFITNPTLSWHLNTCSPTFSFSQALNRATVSVFASISFYVLQISQRPLLDTHYAQEAPF